MLVKHHIKYEEIHGVDETRLMEKGEHRRLHNRLRKEGKCNIPVDELVKISASAHHRGRRLYYSEHVKEYNRKYRFRFLFRESCGGSIYLREDLVYNSKTDRISCWSDFEVEHKVSKSQLMLSNFGVD